MMASLFTFENLYRAYLDCRRRKRCKTAALIYEHNAEAELLDLARELKERTYRPAPSFCFIAKNDKHREVFAAAFRDRVVHHLVVRYLEPVWEPVFIHDSYACRKGKGTHAGVDRLQSFTRKVTANQTRQAWYLQMDIKAFFPSIDRRLLLDMLLKRMDNPELAWLLRIIVLHDPTDQPVFTCKRNKWRNIPRQKSLFGAPQGKGLPIGNLTSQFFANVYLNALDQFTKHSLKARYYIRYVDDFVLMHHMRLQLEEWRERLELFLHENLLLRLNPKRQFIRPVSNGINFLGYVIRPTHLLVRRRTVAKCKNAVAAQITAMKIRDPAAQMLRFPITVYNSLRDTINSYLGVFGHAKARALAAGLYENTPELVFLFRLKGFSVVQRWKPPFKPANLSTQHRYFRARFTGLILMQVGAFWEVYGQDAEWAHSLFGFNKTKPRTGLRSRCGAPLPCWRKRLDLIGLKSMLVVAQTGRSLSRLQERAGCCYKEPPLHLVSCPPRESFPCDQ